MKVRFWASFHGKCPSAFKADLLARFQNEGLEVVACECDGVGGPGIFVASEISSQLHDSVRSARNAGSTGIIVVLGPEAVAERGAAWDLLRSGASDVLIWSNLDGVVKQVQARFERCLSVEQLLDSNITEDLVVGRSGAWRAALIQIVESARFSNSAILLLGESGTGKEVAAKLIHRMDVRSGKRDLVVQDCSTLVQDLSGSEFFGHERGAFTGASSDRQGAFALAHGGTLFLDEIGELAPPVQAQLLRAIQEGTYKRVGGTTWHRADFRLICATNRNLEAMVNRGEFRVDLYHRIAGHVCRLPPLRERLEDVLPLAHFFIRQLRPDPPVPTFDPMVRDYLLRRDYPGNVRELKQVVGRLINRCGGDGTISIGCVSQDERPTHQNGSMIWFDAGFETVILRSVMMGAGLKEIGRAAEDWAIRCAMIAEGGSLRRAALRLGVTGRALQLRRAQQRDTDTFHLKDEGVLPH